ncbi:MAG: TIM barrel protein [Oscillospiraceae bacterium]|nr:TIM barrel protein [Oscillospiraceae bacterium]
MLKLSACLPMLPFGGLDFYDKFKAVKDAGLDYAEFWGWSGLDTDKVKDAAKTAGIKIGAACIDTAVPEVAEVFNKKRLLHRDTEALGAFYKACEESIAVANKLRIPSLIVTVGNERAEVTRYEQHANIVINLKHVAALFEDAGITLVVEPLNVLANHIGYFLPSSYEAFEICNEVGSPYVKVLYDIYHQQISEGNLIPTIRKYFDLIGHFHVADVPGRHEPGTGEINYANVFRAISDLGYNKCVGLEYSPVSDTAESIRKVAEICG